MGNQRTRNRAFYKFEKGAFPTCTMSARHTWGVNNEVGIQVWKSKCCLEANQTHLNGIQRDNKIVLLQPQIVDAFESTFLSFISAWYLKLKNKRARFVKVEKGCLVFVICFVLTVQG